MDNKIKKESDTKEVKLTEDEISSVIELSTEFQGILREFGELHLRKLQVEEENQRLDEIEEELKGTYMTITQRESDIGKRFTKKYGEGRVDTTRGVYIKAKKSI